MVKSSAGSPLQVAGAFRHPPPLVQQGRMPRTSLCLGSLPRDCVVSFSKLSLGEEEIRRSALAKKPKCDLEKVNLSLSALVSFSGKWGKF